MHIRGSIGWPKFLRRALWAVARRGMAHRFDERTRERERIARELHDTLLQGAQALLWTAHALSDDIGPEDPMRPMVAATLARADALLIQGRDRIQNLRAGAGGAVDLAQTLANAWRDLGGETRFSILVEGPSRALLPGAGDEIALIGREALTNALRHSKANALEIEIVFGASTLRLCVRDDGVGFDDQALGAGSLSNHWGLVGMRERARTLHSSLTVWSSPGAGTEIELVVPAELAYATVGEEKRWASRLFTHPWLYDHGTVQSGGR